jgi:hypothetical protein
MTMRIVAARVTGNNQKRNKIVEKDEKKVKEAK